MAAMLEETLQNTRNANAKLNVVLLLMLMPMLVTGLGMSWLVSSLSGKPWGGRGMGMERDSKMMANHGL